MATLDVLRLDAVHPAGGEFSQFWPLALTGPAARRERDLELLGWLTDLYRDSSELVGDEDTVRHFITWLERRSPWPNVALEAIAELLAAEADRELPEWLTRFDGDAELCVVPPAVVESIDRAVGVAVGLSNDCTDALIAHDVERLSELSRTCDSLAVLLHPVLLTVRHQGNDRIRMDADEQHAQRSAKLAGSGSGDSDRAAVVADT